MGRVSGVISRHRSKEQGTAALQRLEERTPVVETKVVPPLPRRHSIQRERLDALLAEAAERKLTILRAPAGFGKTTLALAWVESLRARGDGIAWFSIDSDDDEPRRFAHYLIHALGRAGQVIGRESHEAVRSSPLHHARVLLVNEIADFGDELFLFLDDYHSISHDDIHEFLTFLLRHAPANLHVVMLSRSDPPLELGTFRARGELLEIDATELRFTRDETQAFLELAAPRPLEGREVAGIYKLTEGWPAALRITSISFGAGRDPKELLRSLARSPRSIGGFLDELCALIPPDLVDFMQRTAIASRLSAALCQHLTGRADSQDCLASLERLQLVSALDPARTLFAVHQLFREYLLHRIEREHGGELPELHRRAADWYETNALPSESVKHLLAAGDADAALKQIAGCARDMVERGDLLTLLDWQNQLRVNFVQQPVALQLAMIWAEALSLSRQDALMHITTVEESLDGLGVQQAAVARRECLAFRAITAGLADDLQTADELVEAFELRPDDLPLERESIRNVQRFVFVAKARWEDLYAIPSSVSDEVGDLLPATYRATVVALAEMSQGRTANAERLLRQGLDVGGHIAGFTSAARMAVGPYAELLYETGRIGEAESTLREDIDLIGGGVLLDAVLRGLITMAKLAWRRRSVEQAATILERAEAVGLTRDWPRLVAAALYQRLRFAQQKGSTTTTLGLLKRLQQLRSDGVDLQWRGLEGVRHYCAMAEAAVDLEHNRPKSAVAAIVPLFDEAVACGARLLAVRLGAMLSRAWVLARATPEALRVFKQVLDMVEETSYLSPLVDEGPEVLNLLAQVEVGGPGSADALRARLLRQLHAAASGLWGPAAERAIDETETSRTALTPRECEILELIAEGQSNKTIAKQLGLAPETVKSHLKNIFQKLGVERRTQAVLRAEERGLLRMKRIRARGAAMASRPVARSN
jgi:LuxR family maltose regulon positive regulatory protein